MSEIFPRQDSTKKPAIIVKRIIELLEREELSPGDKLPNEVEIVKQTDISRTAVREALSALELMGIIERIPGEGTFIAYGAMSWKFGPKNTLEKFLEDTEKVNGSFEALEARMVLEPSVAVMAARRAEPEQIEKIEALFMDFVAAFENNDIKLFLDIDREFHLAVAEATNNEVIYEISKSLLARADVHMWHRYKEDLGLLQKTIDAHTKILEAIRNRDPKKAGFYAEKHLARSV
jgi:GntR family transcriptional repressor for pyruvate dehydrogenase complex